MLRASSPTGPTTLLLPISWREMKCPITGQVFPRKVARYGKIVETLAAAAATAASASGGAAGR